MDGEASCYFECSAPNYPELFNCNCQLRPVHAVLYPRAAARQGVNDPSAVRH
jgi:hypothetical protein